MIRFKAKPDDIPAAPAGKAAKAVSKAKPKSTVEPDATATPEKDLLDLEAKPTDKQA